MDFSKIKKIYMIGVKGVGMTMLAQYFNARGFVVSGSDVSEKFMTDEILKKSGIKVFEEFNKNNIPCNADLIIYSTAYNVENNEEVAEALNCHFEKAGQGDPAPTINGFKLKIKTLTFAQALAEVFNQKYGIAVVGSHGKTTITAWLGYVLWRAGLDPNVMVGAKVPQFAGAALVGKSDYLIIEADEYQNKLKYFQPKAVILNNIDYDHPDFFKTKKDYENVFIKFIKKMPAKGFLVANYDDSIIRKIARINCKGKIITYGIDKKADYVAYDIRSKNGKQCFKVKKFPLMGTKFPIGNLVPSDELGDFSIQLFGQHNIANALAVIVTSVELGVNLSKIKKFLGEFLGATRRLQVLGEFNGATIIDDYAHHPTEIKASLSALRQKYGKRKMIVIFHPHTFTRTRIFLKDFAKSFDQADEVIILDIYGSAREKQGGVNSLDLVEAIKQENIKTKKQKNKKTQEQENKKTRKQENIKTLKQQEVVYISTLDKCEEYLRERIENSDVVVLMGAGDVFRVGESLVKSP